MIFAVLRQTLTAAFGLGVGVIAVPLWAQSASGASGASGAPAAAKAASAPAPLVLPANLAPAGTPAYQVPAVPLLDKRAAVAKSAAKPAVNATPKPKPKPVVGQALAPVGAASGAASGDPAGAKAVGRIVQAASETPVKGEILAQKVVRDASGKEQFSPAVNLVMGDIIQFNATFTNMNPVAIKFDPQVSIPADTSLVPGSIQPAEGRLVKSPGGDRVVWKVPHLPPVTWVGASMRVRYDRATEVTVPAVAGTTPPTATSTASPSPETPPAADPPSQAAPAPSPAPTPVSPPASAPVGQ